MEIFEAISVYYLNKKRKSAVLSLKEEMFFEKLIGKNIPVSLIIQAIDNAYYRFGRKLHLRSIARELKSILKERGLECHLDELDF